MNEWVMQGLVTQSSTVNNYILGLACSVAYLLMNVKQQKKEGNTT